MTSTLSPVVRALNSGITLLLMMLCGSAMAAPQPEPSGDSGASGERAEAPASSCVSSFADAQSLRESGDLIAAKGALEQCSALACPEVIVDKCVNWLQEVKQQTPSLVIVAKDADGKDVLDVRVVENDDELVAALGAHPIVLNPGSHALVLTLRGHLPVELDVVLRAGEKNKRVEVSFERAHTESKSGAVGEKPAVVPEPTPDAIEEDGPWWALMWTGVAVGAAGLAIGGVMGGVVLAQESELATQCSEAGCTQQEIDDTRTLAHVSTAGFVVGGAGAALAVVAAIVATTGADEEGATITPIVGPTQFGLHLGLRF